MDYDFAILDLSDDSETATARRRGWIGAVLRGFRDPRPDDELITRWIDVYRTDEVICRGAWLPEGEFGAGPMPVATYASLDKTLNAGLELLPLRMITDVTTSATHRRRGLLKRLIEDDLADAVAQGVPVAALTASEATIYGRWGFGPATFNQIIELDASPGFALRDFNDPGRVELIEPADAWPHVKGVFDTFHTQQRGSVEWPTQYRDIHTGAYDYNDRSANSKVRSAVHLDGDGAVDGFVIFTPSENNVIKVDEMVALTPGAQLGMWSFLAHMDRVTKVTFNLAHPHDPLQWALVDLARL
jgi:predicted acetyltransferase